MHRGVFYISVRHVCCVELNEIVQHDSKEKVEDGPSRSLGEGAEPSEDKE